jgi:hypothetical protein
VATHKKQEEPIVEIYNYDPSFLILKSFASRHILIYSCKAIGEKITTIGICSGTRKSNR